MRHISIKRISALALPPIRLYILGCDEFSVPPVAISLPGDLPYWGVVAHHKVLYLKRPDSKQTHLLKEGINESFLTRSPSRRTTNLVDTNLICYRCCLSKKYQRKYVPHGIKRKPGGSCFASTVSTIDCINAQVVLLFVTGIIMY